MINKGQNKKADKNKLYSGLCISCQNSSSIGIELFEFMKRRHF